MKKSLLQYIWFLSNFRFIASLLQPTEEYPVLPRGFWEKNSNDSLISGYHFTCCCHETPGDLQITRSTNGSSISVNGAEGGLLDWLSRKYHFTYECIPRNLNAIENIGLTLGSIYYLQTGECEMIVVPMVVRHDRFLHFDFLHPLINTPYAILIPSSHQMTLENIEAIWKPFQTNVWIALLVFIVFTTISLTVLNTKKAGRLCCGLGSHAIFVVQTITSQPASSVPADGKRFKIRVVMGTWCLVGLCLTTAYSSVLVSFVMAPQYRPLVDSLEDLAQRDDVEPLVVKDLAADVTISKSNEPLMKKIDQKLNRNQSNNRCQNFNECVQQVKRGSYAFINALDQTGMACQEDFVRTGKCNFAYARKTFFSSYYGWGIQKGHPLRELLNRGILMTMETGLMGEWIKRNIPTYDERCKSYNQARQSNSKGNHPPKLSITNLMGPFIILLFGYITSLIIFVVENILFSILKLR